MGYNINKLKMNDKQIIHLIFNLVVLEIKTLYTNYYIYKLI